MNNKNVNNNLHGSSANNGKEKAEKLVEQMLNKIEGKDFGIDNNKSSYENSEKNQSNKGEELKINNDEIVPNDISGESTINNTAKMPSIEGETQEKNDAKVSIVEDETQEDNEKNAYVDLYANIEDNAVEIDPAKLREKKMKTLLWSAISIVSVFILIVLVALLWEKSNPVLPAGLTEPSIFNPTNVFSDAVKPYVAEDLVFPKGIQERFKPAYAAEQSFVGWLRVPNTSIDMPIYQSKDNNQYLKDNIWGEFSDFGVVFMDYRNNIKKMSRNTVIYGHNYDLSDDDKYTDLQFGEIEQYRKLDFYKDNPVIEFDSLYENYKWKVIACILSNGSSSGDLDGNKGYVFAYHATHMNDDNFVEFIDELEQRSFIHTNVDVLPTDKILTLSTCTYFFDRYGGIQNARCALVARMVREGESEEVDVSKAVVNENVRFPQLYYDVFGGKNPYRDMPKWYPQG